jgi:hypothetical protein
MTVDNKNAGTQNRFVPARFPLQGGAPDHGGGEGFHAKANIRPFRLNVRAPGLGGNFRYSDWFIHSLIHLPQTMTTRNGIGILL